MLVYTVVLLFQGLVPSAGFHSTVALGQFEMVVRLPFLVHSTPHLSCLGWGQWFPGHQWLASHGSEIPGHAIYSYDLQTGGAVLPLLR